jgi:hypothetical protein
VFITLLIGTLDIGQVLFVHQTLVERTRAALRYGTVRPYDAEAIRNMVLYGNPASPDSGGEEDDNDRPPPPGIFGLSPSMVQVGRESIDTNEDRIVVQITGYPFRMYTPFVSGQKRGKPIVASIPYEAI